MSVLFVAACLRAGKRACSDGRSTPGRCTGCGAYNDKGTTWSQPVFILAAGIASGVQRPHRLPRSTPFRRPCRGGMVERIAAHKQGQQASTEPRSRPRCANGPEDARHVAWFGDAGTRRRNVGNHLPIRLASMGFSRRLRHRHSCRFAHRCCARGRGISSFPSASYERMKASTSRLLMSCLHNLPERSPDVADAQLKHLDGLGVAHHPGDHYRV